jgi:hypothetical protein
MGIFREMYDSRQFPSEAEYRELRRALSQAIAGGSIERIPVIRRNRPFASEQWFRDKETGEIYSLIRPEERIRGRWAKVDLEKYS